MSTGSILLNLLLVLQFAILLPPTRMSKSINNEMVVETDSNNDAQVDKENKNVKPLIFLVDINEFKVMMTAM